MAKQQGRELLIKIGDGEASETFATLCGLTAKTMTINNNPVDVTTPDCDAPGGVMWTELQNGAKGFSVAGNGFFEDSASELRMNTVAMSAKALANFQIIVPGFGTFAGEFHVGTFDFSGEAEGGVAYSLSLGSSGAVSFTPA